MKLRNILILSDPKRSCIWFDRDIKKWNSVGTPGCKSWLFSNFHFASSYSVDKCASLLISGISLHHKAVIWSYFMIPIFGSRNSVTMFYSFLLQLGLWLSVVGTIFNFLWKFVTYMLHYEWFSSSTKWKPKMPPHSFANIWYVFDVFNISINFFIIVVRKTLATQILNHH